MNVALILAGGTGQRMRTSGMPKQFLHVYGKPIVIYTVEKFVFCKDVDSIVIACNSQYISYMRELVTNREFPKPVDIIIGGKDRQESVKNGVEYILSQGALENDLVIIHDGVRPLVDQDIISENIRTAQKYGCAMTVKPMVESVVITNSEEVVFDDFKKRDDTYSITSPQTFKLSLLVDVYIKAGKVESPIPLLDAALSCAYSGNRIPLVKEYNSNIKITTPEDFYVLKAILELQENKNIFGLM